MSRNRLFYVLVALALGIVAALAIRTGVATSSIASVGSGSYDEVERNRSNYPISSFADRSYDEVERNRSQFRFGEPADLSDYWLRHRDEIIRMTQPDLSDYALRHPGMVPPVAHTAPDTLPFGPGWAATYGTPSELTANTALPFGPGWAATYGVPAH